MRIVSSRARHKKIMFVECINHCLWTTKRFSFGGKNRDITGREQDHISGAQCTLRRISDRSIGGFLATARIPLKIRIARRCTSEISPRPQLHFGMFISLGVALLNIRCAVTTHSPHSSLHFSSADFACHYTFHCSLRPSLHFSMLAALVTTVYTIRRTRHYTSQYYIHSSLHFSMLTSPVTTLFNVRFARHYTF
jgi:hypothetical protein